MKKGSSAILYPRFIYSCNTSHYHDDSDDDESSSKESWTTPIPFSPFSAILLLGEGNFSFAASLIIQLSNIGYSNLFLATCMESKEILYKKYPEAEDNVKIITKHSGKVMFSVDATRACQDRRLLNKPWTRIIFQFPHLGTGIKDQAHNIYHHQKFLRAIFQSSYKLFTHDSSAYSLSWNLSMRKHSDHGHATDVLPHILEQKLQERPELHITLKTGLPYDQWEIKKLAKSEFQCLTSFPFIPAYYPGYQHVNTNASNNHQDHLNGKPCVTTVFTPKSQFIQRKRNRVATVDI